VYSPVSLEQYASTWRQWLTEASLKSITGLDQFAYANYTCGTSQAFDHFWLRNSSKRLVCFAGDFQYHSCVGKHLNFTTITHWKELQANDALILSCPFSDLGSQHPQQLNILDTCNKLGIPVCLDLAYWGISKNISVDLNKWPCVQEVTSSLSKPFYTLENHRVGIRFTRSYVDDGISMINEVKMQNNYSMSLGVHYMTEFSADWNWQTFGDAHAQICKQNQFRSSDTVIFGLSSDPCYSDYNRGIPDNNRICISDAIQQIYT
jgi:hypothetical protein